MMHAKRSLKSQAKPRRKANAKPKLRTHVNPLLLWENIIMKEENLPFRFLVMVMPYMQKVFTRLRRFVNRECPELNSWISEDLLRQLIMDKFSIVVNPVIQRACVLEMHVAKRNGLLEGKTPEERFDFFIDNIKLKEVANQMLSKYPIINDQIDICVSQFCDTTEELLGRLNKDKAHLIKTFFKGVTGFKINSISTTGDVHQQGRHVSVIQFVENDKVIKLVYKPRSMAIDIAFQNFIGWYNKHAKRNYLRSIFIDDQRDYGWCEFIEYKSCKNKSEVKQFYYRLGVWLTLTYFFRGSDVHGENLIASGAHPVVIDYECLMKSVIRLGKEKIKSLPHFMVDATAFLPRIRVSGKKHKGLDSSALGSEEGAEGLREMIKWVDAGKDTMHAERTRGKMIGFLNKPRLNGKVVEYLDYENEFVSGFREAYQVLLDHKAELINRKDSPLNEFKNAKVRLVLKDTSTYVTFLIESWHPRSIHNYKAREEHFNNLLTSKKMTRAMKSVTKSERRDLYQNNVPFFTAFTDQHKVYDSYGKSISVPVDITGFDSVIEHINDHFDKTNLKLQTILIQNSFSVARENRGMNTYVKPSVSLTDKPLPLPILKNQALDLAKNVLDEVFEDKFVINDRVVWPSSYVDDSENWYMTFGDADMYSGSLGIALTFLYASEVYNEKRYLELSNRIVNDFCKTLKKEALMSMPSAGGGFEGLGGLLYILSIFYRKLRKKSIKNTMSKILNTLPKSIKKDEKFDALAGSAGLIVVLLSLQDIFPKRKLLSLSKRAVNRLLKVYPKPSEFPEVEGGIDAVKPLLGFAHGAIGIAWGLSHYYAHVPDKKVKNWITAALAYERREFDDKKKQWPDFRGFAVEKMPGKQFPHMVAWCHGAVGEGLARLDMLNMLPSFKHNKNIKDDIQLAFNATWKQGMTSFSCLCHGNWSAWEFLHHASDVYGTDKLAKQSHQFANALIRSMQKDGYRCMQLINSASSGLMLGRAGVAYALMLFAQPDKLPCVLLLKS